MIVKHTVDLYEILFEEMLTSDDAKSLGLGLVGNSKEGLVYLTLFDVEACKSYLNTVKPQDLSIKKLSEVCIHGYIRFGKKAPQIYQVYNSAATKGIGPLMYDFVLGYCYPDYVVADDWLKEGAEKIWNYYFTKRNDVEKKHLEEIDGNFFEHKKDNWGTKTMKEKPFLSYGFRRSSSEYKNLVSFAKNELNKSENRIKFDEAKRLLTFAAEQFFNLKYHGFYTNS